MKMVTDKDDFDRRVVLEPQEVGEDSTRAGLAVVKVDQEEETALSFENFHYDSDGEPVPTRAALAPFPDGLKAVVELKEMYDNWADAE